MKDLDKWAEFWQKRIIDFHPMVKPLCEALLAIMGMMVMMNREIEALKDGDGQGGR